MAYRLPSPKFRVQNLLNRTKTYGSARKIIWNKVGRADKYNIYRSYIPYGKFTLLATVSGDTTEYIDETVDFSNIPEIIANNIDYDSIARDWEISGEFDSIDGDVYHYVN